MRDRLEFLLIDPVITEPKDCPGLRETHVMGDFDFGDIRGHVDGRAASVLQMLEFMNGTLNQKGEE